MELRTVGVVGAGTMGAGIAQVAAQASLAVVLYDVAEAQLGRALDTVRSSLERFAERGRIDRDTVDATLGRIAPTTSFAALGPADLTIEAAPEDLDLKRRIFADLGQTCRPEAVLATNTSSLPVTQIAAAAERPERVVGMHFFNPAPLMALVEVVRGQRTSAEAVALAVEAARRFGKTPVVAKDAPGFIGNRVARPFYLEALRILADSLADAPTVDRIVRALGFRMGPFELMDLVGLDVNLAVSKSLYEQSFHEPRYRPSPIQQQLVQAGLLGRKTGRGFYEYAEDRPIAPEPAVPSGPPPRVAVLGAGELAQAIRAAADTAGLLADPDSADLLLDDEADERALERSLGASAGRTVAVQLRRGALSALAGRAGNARLVGFRIFGPFAEARLVELSLAPGTSPQVAELAAAFFRAVGKDAALVGDAVAGVAERIVAQVVNEAAFALGEGVASAADVDLAMRLGFNWPLGPLEWGDRLGAARVHQTLVRLLADTGDPRYRPAPLLSRLAEAGGSLLSGRSRPG